MSIVTPDGILNVENATLRVPSIEVQGVNVTTALSTLSNVGIGTASPDERLHVHGPDAGFILQSNLNSATMEIGGPGGAVMDLKGAFTDDYDLRIKTTGSGGVISSVGEANHIVVGASSGYTGFGVASPQFKIDAQGSAGVDAVSNPITHNPVILFDDQESTTTFSGTSGGSSSGRDTTNKYYELNSLTQTTVGYIHWPIQLPNSFTAEFERYSGGGTGGHNIIFSFFNTSAPTTDGDNGGYKVYISERYGGSAAVAIKRGNTELKNSPLLGYSNATWQKVVVSYDRGSISVSFNNKVLLTYKDSQQAHAYTGNYMGFLGTTDALTNYHRIRNVKITSGSAKWLYAETDTSNASALVYLSGNVGIGTQTPTELLEVSGNVKVSSGYHLMGDGGLISNIATTLQSISDQGNTVSNTIQFTNTTTGLTSTGNVEVTNNKFFKGDGGLISNIATTLGDIVDQGNTTSNTMIFSSSNVGLQSSGNVEVINNKFFKGDGGLISNIATTLQAISDQGNVTSNTIKFTHSDVGFVTTANVGIANSAPTVSLSVGSNLHVDEYGSNVLDIVGNVSMSNLTLSGFGIEASYGLQHVTAENATTANTITLTHASKALDITSNVEMGGTLKFDSNAAITSVTGDVINQGFMEQPTQGLTTYHTYIEGHGTYEASASSEDINNSFNAWEAFDSDTSTRWAIGSELGYNTTSGEWDATAITNFPTINTIDVAGTRHSGHWLQIKLPYQIVLSHSNVFPLTGVTARAPKDGVILGSNDGEDWYELQRFTGKTYTDNQWTQIDVNAEASYQYFRMCITKLGSGHNIINLTEWRLFAKDRITKLADNLLLNGSIASDTLNTGYIKWPKIQLLANSQSGYEVSVSSQYDATVPGYLAFNGIGGHLSSEGWTSGSTTFDATSGAAHSSNAALFDGVRCEWIQLKLPRNKKIKLSHFVIFPRTNSGASVSPEDAPKEGAMYGSNDGTTWTKLVTYSGLTYGGAAGDDSEKVVVRSDTRYQYFRLTVTKRNIATAGGTWIDIAELMLFERSLGVAQNPDKATLQVGGSLGLAKGSEILAGDDIVMELDGPHDRPLVKYPPIKMTAATTSSYVASSSQEQSNLPAWEAFDHNTTVDSAVWETSGGRYSTSSPYAHTAGVSTTVSGAAYLGDWIQLQMPHRVKVSYVDIMPQVTYGLERMPGTAVFAGSDDGTLWKLLGTVTNNSAVVNTYTRYNVNATQAYKYIRIIWNKLTSAGSNAGYRGRAAAQEIGIYGYEEGDVSTDLTLSSVYNKPGTDQLDVYWDANDKSSYAGAGTSVTDISGNGVTGTLANGVGFDTEYNAFTFDGTNDVIHGTPSGITGEFVHSFAGWFYLDSETSTYDYPFFIGSIGSTNQSSILLSYGQRRIFAAFGQHYGFYPSNGFFPNVGQWYHACVTYKGGNLSPSSVKLYIDGVALDIIQETTQTSALNIGANHVSLGASNSAGTGSPTNGRIGNFRLFSKALSANQVKELYDWQKDHFLGSRSSMTLYKGNLGLGVAEPTSRLEIAGSERIQEYPTRAMTSGENYMEGHGVFKARWSNWYDGNTRWGMYNKKDAVGGQENIWYGPYQGNNGYSGGDVYSGTDFAASTTSGLYLDDVNGNRYHGAWTTIEMPYDILLNSIHLYQGSGSEGISSRCAPEDGVILGSDNGSDWHHVHTFIGLQYGGSLGSYAWRASGDRVVINATTPYRHYALVTTRTLHYAFTVIIGELKWFGTPVSSTLDDGQLTLGKTLTTSRISGHAVVGAETPRADNLIAYLDTTTGSDKSTPTSNVVVRAYDSSGLGNNAKFHANALYDAADRSFVFDGTGDYIGRDETSSADGCRGFPTGDAIYSMSSWIYINGTQGSYCQLMTFGSSWASVQLATMYLSGGTKLGADIGSNDVKTTNAVLTSNTWHHVAIVKSGTGQISTAIFDMYVDGVAITDKTASGSGTQALGTISGFSLGLGFNGTSGGAFKGRMSNPKVWSVALTADDIAKEYALGRTGKALNIVDTAVCIGGGTAPNAQLDVRGSALITGNLGIGTTNPVAQLHSRGNVLIGDRLPYNEPAHRDAQLMLCGTHNSGKNYNKSNQIKLLISGGDNESASPYYIFCEDENGHDQFWLKGSESSGGTEANMYVNGFVGIGTDDPSPTDSQYGGHHLHVFSSDQNAQVEIGTTASNYDAQLRMRSAVKSWFIRASGSSHGRMTFNTNSGQRGYIEPTVGGGQMNFTGQHRTFVKDIPHANAINYEGMIVSADQNKYIKMSGGIAAGSNAITTNESLPIVSLTTKINDKKCFGVISTSEDPETRETSFGNFVSVEDKELGDTRVYINSVGEGAIWVTDINGPLESGDYITTSNVVGYGQKQDSEFLANYTVAKITMDCDFSPATQPVQRIVKELGNVNYWASTTYSDVALDVFSNLAAENRRTVTTTQYSNEEGIITPTEYSNLESNVQATYSEIETVTYQKIEREESMIEQKGWPLEVREEPVNVLDEHGQIRWEDHPTETEKAYKIRYLDADGKITTEANKVYTAAFVGCTYHCG